jgi:hypothetical protein
VLANYTIYQRLFRLETDAERLEVPPGKASNRVASQNCTSTSKRRRRSTMTTEQELTRSFRDLGAYTWPEARAAARRELARRDAR